MRLLSGVANGLRSCCSSVRSGLAGLFSAAIFSTMRSRAWYFTSIPDCRRPYLPLKPTTASAKSAMSENARAQNHGESVIPESGSPEDFGSRISDCGFCGSCELIGDCTRYHFIPASARALILAADRRAPRVFRLVPAHCLAIAGPHCWAAHTLFEPDDEVTKEICVHPTMRPPNMHVQMSRRNWCCAAGQRHS